MPMRRRGSKRRACTPGFARCPNRVTTRPPGLPSGADMKRALSILLAAATLLAAGETCAQTWPTRPITLMVGFAAGGATDTAARIIAKKLSDNLGVPVVVDNKAGAGGNIAAQAAATSPPDGYLIHLSS